MQHHGTTTCVAFDHHRLIAGGTLADVVRAAKQALDGGAHGPVLIFDDRTGRQTPLDGMPAFSPDGTRFFVTDDDEANTHDNNIEIWRRDGDGAVMEWAHPVKQIHVEAPALTETYHVSVSDWSKPETIALAFSSGRQDWDGQLTHGAKGWALGANWPKE